MLQQPRIVPARFGRRPLSAHGVTAGPHRSPTPRVTVTWTPANDAPSAPTELELVAELAGTTTWSCGGHFESDWVRALASARCSEVVLTARLDDDQPAKHLVLELAELLTLELAATQPLIRVRFLPTSSKRRGARSHA